MINQELLQLVMGGDDISTSRIMNSQLEEIRKGIKSLKELGKLEEQINAEIERMTAKVQQETRDANIDIAKLQRKIRNVEARLKEVRENPVDYNQLMHKEQQQFDREVSRLYPEKSRLQVKFILATMLGIFCLFVIVRAVLTNEFQKLQESMLRLNEEEFLLE